MRPLDRVPGRRLRSLTETRRRRQRGWRDAATAASRLPRWSHGVAAHQRGRVPRASRAGRRNDRRGERKDRRRTPRPRRQTGVGARPTSASRKQPPAAGAAFVWDVAGNSGYMLNDPLQAYAPIAANRQFTNITVSAAPSNSAPERVAGHPCQPTDVTVAASDGSATVCRAWRATDLKGFPMRITCASNGTLLTLSLSNVRLEALPGDLFRPPNDFTKYNSAQALMNELEARQQDIKRRPTYYGTDQSEMLGSPEIHQPNRPQ